MNVQQSTPTTQIFLLLSHCAMLYAVDRHVLPVGGACEPRHAGHFSLTAVMVSLMHVLSSPLSVLSLSL